MTPMRYDVGRRAALVARWVQARSQPGQSPRPTGLTYAGGDLVHHAVDNWDPATIEAKVRTLMAQHAAVQSRGYDSERARAALRVEIDMALDEWALLVGVVVSNDPKSRTHPRSTRLG